MASAAAKAPPEEKEDETGEETPAPAKSGSILAFVGVMAILTALGVGSGGLLGLHLKGRMEPATETRPEALNGQHLKTGYPASMGLKPLTPIVASLASPERTWIRLEAALVMEGDQSPEAKLLAAEIGEDIVAFLRTVPLSQVQGASGFQHLREDLNDRVRVRSGGKVRDLLIQALIIE